MKTQFVHKNQSYPSKNILLHYAPNFILNMGSNAIWRSIPYFHAPGFSQDIYWINNYELFLQKLLCFHVHSAISNKNENSPSKNILTHCVTQYYPEGVFLFKSCWRSFYLVAFSRFFFDVAHIDKTKLHRKNNEHQNLFWPIMLPNIILKIFFSRCKNCWKNCREKRPK